MKLDFSLMLIFYTLSLLVLFSFSSFFLFWMLMEINLCIFMVFALYLGSEYEEFNSLSQCFYYLLVQCLSGMMFLLGSMYSTTLLGESANTFILVASISLKLGLSPFHSWFFKFCKGVGLYIMLTVLTVQKFPYIYLFTFFELEECFIFLMTSVVMGSILVINSNNFVDFLASSSVYAFVWMYTFIIFNSYLGALNLAIYFLVTFMFITKTINLNMELYLFKSVAWFYFFCYSFSLPPLNLFFFKFFSMNFMINFYGVPFFLIIWIASLLVLLGYFKYLYQFGISYYSYYKMFGFKILDLWCIFPMSFLSLCLFFY